MKITVLVLLLIAFVCADSHAEDKLLQLTDLTYLGAFRPPQTDGNGVSFGYGGGAMSYNPVNNSLFLTDIWHGSLAEIQIPAQNTWLNTATATSLSTATVLQNFTTPLDTTDGIGTLGGSCASTYIGGTLPYGSVLIGASYAFYDASSCAITSHWTSGTDMSIHDDFGGYYTVGAYNPGMAGGAMTDIPTAWQSALGGAVLTGQSTLSVITRTSLGPSASAFDPDRLGVDNPVTATLLVGYPDGHQSLQSYTHGPAITNQYTSPADKIGGIVFPVGSKTVLFIGRHGTGDWCYGQGTTVAENDWQDIGGENNCYDPDDTSKGEHAYPYVNQVWAYSADDFAAVKAGAKQPWELTPYAMWELNFPITQGHDGLQMGVGYDPSSQIIYITQPRAYGMDNWPVIHAYSVNLSGSAISGICGSSNGIALSSAPTIELCTAGTPSAVTGTGPWSWTCAGSGGGSTVSCSASVLNNPSSAVPLRLGERGSITVGPDGSLKTN